MITTQINTRSYLSGRCNSVHGLEAIFVRSRVGRTWARIKKYHCSPVWACPARYRLVISIWKGIKYIDIACLFTCLRFSERAKNSADVYSTTLGVPTG